MTDNIARNEWFKTRETCGAQENKKEVSQEGDSELRKIGLMPS